MNKTAYLLLPQNKIHHKYRRSVDVYIKEGIQFTFEIVKVKSNDREIQISSNFNYLLKKKYCQFTSDFNL